MFRLGDSEIKQCLLRILRLVCVTFRVGVAQAGLGADTNPLCPFALSIAQTPGGQPQGGLLVVLSGGLRFVIVSFSGDIHQKKLWAHQRWQLRP